MHAHPQPPTTPPGGHPPNGTADKFAAFLQAVRMKLKAGQLAEAHLALSALYDNPNLPPEQAQEVTDLLDQLAGTVIYSRQHLLAQSYRVRPGDTLEQIAHTYKVPTELLARINGIRNPQRLEPGRELKVVPGPFGALIDLGKYELVLMVGGRYAGRFPIGVGRDHVKLEGSYTVRDKIPNPPYYSPDVNFSPEDPNNPLGELWIDLGNQIGIHGTNDPQNLHRTGGRGSICLAGQDIADVFGILSIGSRVIIRR
jgi:lipoprotein-anchoring transpeptidase ErfK/SrfK